MDELFNSLVVTTLYVLAGEPIYPEESHLKWLVKDLSAELKKMNLTKYYVATDELQQQLSLIWIESTASYEKNKPSITKRSYLIRMSVWGLRDWLWRELRSRVRDTTPPKGKPEFTLDLKFLFEGADIAPLTLLTSYERYLIFLRYQQDKHIFEMADVIQKDEKTIRHQLKKALNKLRSASNAKE